MSLKRLQELQETAHGLQSAWYRNILTIASGSLALLSGVSPPVPNDPAKYLLAATWVLLGIGILSGSAATYLEVSRARNLREAYREQLLRSLRSTGAPSVDDVVLANPKKIFLWSQTAMVVSLISAVVCLVGYSVSVTLSS